jgi:DHA2 family multidrug resistance protein
MFVSGAFLLLCALIRRLRQPNFLVDLPYLKKWNTIVLGFALFFFRFVLLATIVIIPQSLALRGLDAAQYGPAIVWTAVFQLGLAFIGALLLNNGFDTRLLMAIGFAAIAFACVINADFTSVWAAENYYRSELLMAVGQSFAMSGLVSSIILQAAFSGGLDAPQRALTFSAFFHVIRLFGGQTGAVMMGHFIAEREKLHSNLLGLHVQAGDWITADTVRHLSAGLAAKSNGPMAATGRALGVISGRVRLQAYTLTLIDAFHLVAWACAAMLFLTVFLRKSPMSFGQVAALQEGLTPAKETKA